MGFSAVISHRQTVTPKWQWHNHQGLPYLTCNLLQKWQHGFFTQQFYPHSPEFLVNVLNPQAEVFRLNQVHGRQVVLSREICDADGIITNQPQESVWVASADCTPILIGDIITNRVAAIHSGWRGTAQEIIKVAIAHFQSLGSSPENLRFALGPAISGQVYQVSEEVAAQVCNTIIPPLPNNEPATIIQAVQKLPSSPLLPDSTPSKIRLDIRQVIKLQLQLLGIKEEQMAIAPYCTYQQPEYFFSYRRTKQKQVQWSGIVSN